MLKIFKNKYFFLKVVKTNTKKKRLEKPKNEKLLLLIPKRRYQVFQELNISNKVDPTSNGQSKQ